MHGCILVLNQNLDFNFYFSFFLIVNAEKLRILIVWLHSGIESKSGFYFYFSFFLIVNAEKLRILIVWLHSGIESKSGFYFYFSHVGKGLT